MVRIDFNRLRFLVIDDNAHMRRILRTLLHGFGAREVYEAEDGAAGLEAFLAADQSSPSQRAQRNEEALRLAEALEHLPETQREALVLQHWHGWSLSEIAAPDHILDRGDQERRACNDQAFISIGEQLALRFAAAFADDADGVA